MEKDQGGIKGITYPLVADTQKTISTNYGVLCGDYELDENEQLCSRHKYNIFTWFERTQFGLSNAVSETFLRCVVLSKNKFQIRPSMHK